MRGRDQGSALLLALVAAGLLAALGAGLVMLGTTEGAIAANFRASGETFHAADAAAERAMQDLLVAGHWTDVLSGSLPSTFVDSTLTPTLATKATIDLAVLTADLQQQSDAGASWGANNPRWRLFAYGPLAAVDGTGAVQSAAYLMTWIADDPAETDGDPFTDGNGRITLLARAIGFHASARTVEVTLSRSGPGRAGARVLSWRERR